MARFTVYYMFNGTERKQVITATNAETAEKIFKNRYKHYEFLRAEEPKQKVVD